MVLVLYFISLTYSLKHIDFCSLLKVTNSSNEVQNATKNLLKSLALTHRLAMILLSLFFINSKKELNVCIINYNHFLYNCNTFLDFFHIFNNCNYEPVIQLHQLFNLFKVLTIFVICMVISESIQHLFFLHLHQDIFIYTLVLASLLIRNNNLLYRP